MKTYCLFFVAVLAWFNAGAQSYPALDSLTAKMPACIKANSAPDCEREFFWAVKDMVLDAYAEAEKQVPQAEKAAFTQEQEKWAATADYQYALNYKKFKEKHPRRQCHETCQ